MVRLMGGGMGGFRVRAGLSKCAARIATRIAECAHTSAMRAICAGCCGVFSAISGSFSRKGAQVPQSGANRRINLDLAS
jgi:hypothetical protein